MTEPTRAGNGRYTRSPDTAARDAQAATLRARGLTYQQIADALGMSSRGDAHKAVERALAATLQEPCDALRTLEAERLDRLTAEAWAVLERRHVVVSNGRVVRHPGTGEELLDDGPVLAAIDRLLKISERRSKLFGLDAPARMQVMTMDAIDAEIARLNAEIAAGDAASVMEDDWQAEGHGDAL